jgi:hypothetical protein
VNTFVLSYDPREAARFHCNKHVVKMILESAQMLCTSHWLHLLYSEDKSLNDFKRVRDAQAWLYENTPKDLQPPWKLTHARHPCTLWTASNVANYSWQLNLCKALLHEYKLRYNKVHKTSYEAKWLSKNLPLGIKEGYLENFPVCMKDDFKVYREDGTIDVVASYKQYYIKDKVRFAKWEPKTKTPQWFLDGVKK